MRVAALGLVFGLAGLSAAQGQTFYATNVRPVDGDRFIRFDFATGGIDEVGVIHDAGGDVLDGFSGLDWSAGLGQGSLVGSIGWGDDAGEFYTIEPDTAQATFLGASDVAFGDLAYNPVTERMYGVANLGDGSGVTGLWRDDNGDSIPENFLGPMQHVGIDLPTGLGFDVEGNAFVQDIVTDEIYRAAGDDPATFAPYFHLGFNSNESQGLYVWATTGYYASDNEDGPENYTFATEHPVDFTLESTFGAGVLIGDLTPVPEPGALALLAMGGLVAFARRR